ncbi:MAG: hypothetical protein IPJ81_18070 [Chitinophagaceae bacterium]|nr:hypothetical protein [Chitinophagaceae bacterium]
MALKADAKEKIKKFGLDVDKLIAAIKDDNEVDVEIPEMEVMKKEDLEARDNNKIAEGKKLGEKEGESKGKELAAKAFRKKFALEDTVGNDVDKVVEAVNTKLATGDEGLKKQIELLQKDKETLQSEKTTLETKAKQATFDSQLISFFPANRTADLKDSERLTLAKMDLTFEEVDGKPVVKRNGEIIRDKTTQNPLPVNQVITDYFTERKWIGAQGNEGGRGGGDKNPGAGGTAGVKKYTEFEEKWKAENPGKTELSLEFQDALTKHSKEHSDFNMNE